MSGQASSSLHVKQRCDVVCSGSLPHNQPRRPCPPHTPHTPHTPRAHTSPLTPPTLTSTPTHTHIHQPSCHPATCPSTPTPRHTDGSPLPAPPPCYTPSFFSAWQRQRRERQRQAAEQAVAALDKLVPAAGSSSSSAVSTGQRDVLLVRPGGLILQLPARVARRVVTQGR